MRALAVLSTVLLPLILLCASAGQSSPDQILGRWRTLATSQGGIGAMLEFHADGVVDYSPGAVVELPWRMEDGQLVLPSGKVGGPEQKKTIKWLSENKMQMVSPAGVVEPELSRVGERSDAANPVIGEWTGLRIIGEHKLDGRWFFCPAGKGLFLLPFATVHGHYVISGSMLHVELPNQKSSDQKFEVVENILILKGEKGDSRYGRY